MLGVLDGAQAQGVAQLFPALVEPGLTKIPIRILSTQPINKTSFWEREKQFDIAISKIPQFIDFSSQARHFFAAHFPKVSFITAKCHSCTVFLRAFVNFFRPFDTPVYPVLDTLYSQNQFKASF